jgi:hypothetical protein
LLDCVSVLKLLKLNVFWSKAMYFGDVSMLWGTSSGLNAEQTFFTLTLMRSKLSLENKILLYKCILKPIWTYGIQLWGCTKPSNTKVLQRFQSNVLRSLTNAPWYVSNLTLHNDLQIPFATEEIKKYSTIYHSRLIRHENNQVTELSNPLHAKRRLRRQWPSDFIVEREEEE